MPPHIISVQVTSRSMLHHGSVGASWEYNKRNLTLTLTFNVPLPSIFYHNKIFLFIMFTALSFLQLTHGLFLIWGTSWTLWKSCFSIYEYIYILKIYFRQNKSYKKRAFFFRDLFFFFTLNSRFLYELKAQGSCLWNCVWDFPLSILPCFY